jgi:hypothetical protein
MEMHSDFQLIVRWYLYSEQKHAWHRLSDLFDLVIGWVYSPRSSSQSNVDAGFVILS